MSDGSNGRILGTIAGAAAAYFTGGASYVALGATLGGAIGSLADPKQKIEGPRLDDRKVQTSSYGVGIPRLYGTQRLSGNVIWSTDKLEIASVTSSGKGGGGTENTNYKYYVHMSALLCETPRDGSTISIVKFLQDGKPIWDISSGIPIGSALASAENPYASFVLFQGHQDQLPDPIEESWTGGPGSCSAYRGVVRIRMIAIECPGGRVPQFSFVLSNGAVVTTSQNLIETIPNTQDLPGTNMRGYLAGFSANAFTFIRKSGGSLLSRSVVDSVYIGVEEVMATPVLSNYVPNGWSTESAFVMWDDTGSRNQFAIYKADGDVVPFTAGYSTTGASVFSFSGNSIVACAIDAPYDFCVSSDAGTFSGVLAGKPINSCINGAVAYVILSSAGVSEIAVIDLATGAVGSMAAPVADQRSNHIVFDGSDLYYADNGQSLYKRVAGAWVVWMTGIPSIEYDNKLGVVNGLLYTLHKGSGQYIVTTRGLTTPVAKVKDVIAAECSLAGGSAVDVSGIPDADTVIGYMLATPASARANVEPLLALIGGYAVDEDGATKFRKFSDITSVATVTFDELGQAEGDASGEAMPLTRTQEIDLPRSVTTTYIEATSDYQTASEVEVRQVTDATEDVQVQLPICITSDQAKKVSQMVLYDRWRRQNSRSTTVSRKFAAVSPGDGVTIEYPRGTFRLWLVLSTNDTGAVCEWSLCPGDTAIFTQTAIGATGYTSQQVTPLAAPLRAQILDIPPLRDADNNAGPYVALDSYADVPADGELLVGDDDTTLQSRGTVSASAPIGFAETVLAGWTRSLVDETNMFTVNLGDDVFASVTRDVLLAGGAEYWAYGAPGRWEIGASAQGNSLGDGRYILSRHLRGLFGTERFVGTHVAGDVFVLLRIAGILRPDTGVGGIGQTKSYRAVAKGRGVDSIASQTYANTGEGLTPLSPVNLRRTDTNDFTVDRRSRLAMNNLTGALPIGEATEAYSWAFYSSGTYATLLGTVVTNTPTVTAAQVTAIGVTPSAAAFLKVRQVSDSIGPGHELQATA